MLFPLRYSLFVLSSSVASCMPFWGCCPCIIRVWAFPALCGAVGLCRVLPSLCGIPSGGVCFHRCRMSRGCGGWVVVAVARPVYPFCGFQGVRSPCRLCLASVGVSAPCMGLVASAGCRPWGFAPLALVGRPLYVGRLSVGLYASNTTL